MENSPLNMAHFNQRKADNHLRFRRFDEAIECHQKTADYLEETLKNVSVSSPLAIESIKLQKEFHLKQRELIRIKKLQYEKYKVAIDNQTQKNHSIIVDTEGKQSKNKTENSCQLQLAIYKTMEEADSLLEVLSKRGDTDSVKSMESELDNNTNQTDNMKESKDDMKKSKDEPIVTELRSLNHQLHIMVFQLVTQLDESIMEGDLLRDKIDKIEKQKIEQLLRVQKGNLTDNIQNFVQNPCDDENPLMSSGDDVSPNANDQELAPLELPIFDFDTFSSGNINLEKK